MKPTQAARSFPKTDKFNVPVLLLSIDCFSYCMHTHTHARAPTTHPPTHPPTHTHTWQFKAQKFSHCEGIVLQLGKLSSDVLSKWIWRLQMHDCPLNDVFFSVIVVRRLAHLWTEDARWFFAFFYQLQFNSVRSPRFQPLLLLFGAQNTWRILSRGFSIVGNASGYHLTIFLPRIARVFLGSPK